LPENLLAWELYQIAQLGDVGRMIWNLRTIHLTEAEANEVAFKITVIAAEFGAIEKKRADEEALKQKFNHGTRS
jgi:hypothetical protein